MVISVIISTQYVFISVLSIRYSIKAEKVKHMDHLVDHEEGGHNEERFFFGLCPISLNTLSIQNEDTSTSLRELKVITINGRVINRKCTRTNALKTNTKYPKHFKEDKLVWEEIFVSCKSSIDKCPKLKKLRTTKILPCLGMLWVSFRLLCRSRRTKTGLEATQIYLQNFTKIW